MIDPVVVDRLLRLEAADAPVLSVYLSIPPDPGEIRGVEARFNSLLTPARETVGSEELSHSERESLRHDTERVLAVGKRARELLGHTVAVFACKGAGLYEELVLPRRVRDRVVVGPTPYVRPLLAVLDESHRYCVAVVDRENAWIYEFFMGELEDASHFRGEGLRQPNYAGGWQGYREHRVHDKAELLARRHFRETSDTIDELVRRTGAELVIVGGHEETVAQFVAYLPHHLQPSVAGRFTIDPTTMSPAQVRERAEEAVDAYERDEERRLVDEALHRAAASRLGATGLDPCLTAVNEHAVQLLLVQDDEQYPGRACDNCGWLGLEGEECPVCGQSTRKAPDVIDEMAATVLDTSGRVEHVYADTPLARHAVAALLRFPIAALTGE